MTTRSFTLSDLLTIRVVVYSIPLLLYFLLLKWVIDNWCRITLAHY
jgi:hypothetical protein